MDKVSELLRAMVQDDGDAADGLSAEITEGMWNGRSGNVLNAAFYLTANRRFGDKPLEDALGWVAALRGRLGDDADEVDPRYAEWMIRAATRNEVALLEKIDPETYIPLQLLVTAQLVLQEERSEPELEALLNEAEQLATKWESED